MNIIQRSNGNSYDVDTGKGMYEYLVEEMKDHGFASNCFSMLEELYRRSVDYSLLSEENYKHSLKLEKLLLDLVGDIEAYYRNNTEGKKLNPNWKAFNAAKDYFK